ncbi:sigma-70 family RNA polymerase sigma factor [Micromonospora sp. NPDC048898]|uniref:sigma-70 family RNA polymerase sigma factor n=1 Tax=Micromonospora sp. NPDC048898 TaxID=3364260 RepID=UPI003724A104
MSPQTVEDVAGERLRELLAAHRGPLTRFVKGLISGQHHNAEDVVQETLIRAWRHIDRVPEGDDDSRRWLFTVAHHLVIDQVRRRKARPVEVFTALTVDRATVGDQTASAAVANDSFLSALRRLGPAHRRVLHDIYVRNLSAQEVADQMQVPVGTIRSRLHYATRSLRLAVIG